MNNIKNYIGNAVMQLRRLVTTGKQTRDPSLETLVEEYRQEMLSRKLRGSYNVRSLVKALRAYHGEAVSVGKVDKTFVEGFITFLCNGYTTRFGRHAMPRTVHTYCAMLRAALSVAVKKGYISTNPFDSVAMSDNVHITSSQRDYLTIAELGKMVAANCPREEVKRAYLFSCYCGLRLSDIRSLTWGNIVYDGERWRIAVRMQKTGNMLYMPLSEHALKCLPERNGKEASALTFGYLPTITTIETTLGRWVGNAGIAKHITFHTARHTFATLMLTLGADIYTTSKLLGHSSISTTTIYARIVDKKKDEAISLIDKMLD